MPAIDEGIGLPAALVTAHIGQVVIQEETRQWHALLPGRGHEGLGGPTLQQAALHRAGLLAGLVESEQACVAQGDGSYARLMGQLQKTDLLILDDRGMQKMTAPQRQDLMEVIEDRHGRGSTLIASQLPIERTTTSARRRWPTPSWTGCCTAPIA